MALGQLVPWPPFGRSCRCPATEGSGSCTPSLSRGERNIGNDAAGSTLRLTPCLLGIELRHMGPSGTRMTFGKAGEAALSQWMVENARVCWIEHDESWTLESEFISQLDLLLNLDQNRHNPTQGTEIPSPASCTGVDRQRVDRPPV
ncbi:GIY-YIG nuclease family protein [Streptomyces sp. NPDC058108]|uniref:GIY-YIG nuclease family protein n=1 Tax=Streptomyces sp. NPDC058108 TaxID=3346344 RepID=UPI0036F0BE90